MKVTSKAKAVRALTLALIFTSTTFATNLWADGFPIGPDRRLTTGSLCERGDSHRYAEQIRYCDRNVTFERKWEIIDQYEEIGYEIREVGRSNFKIDHFIPLCAGGSNDDNNLWPQHKSVYEQTDRIEEMVCRAMSQGLLTQDEGVEMVTEAKLHLEKAPGIQAELAEKLAPHSIPKI